VRLMEHNCEIDRVGIDETETGFLRLARPARRLSELLRLPRPGQAAGETWTAPQSDFILV
jgi:hypothetical protein